MPLISAFYSDSKQMPLKFFLQSDRRAWTFVPHLIAIKYRFNCGLLGIRSALRTGSIACAELFRTGRSQSLPSIIEHPAPGHATSAACSVGWPSASLSGLEANRRDYRTVPALQRSSGTSTRTALHPGAMRLTVSHPESAAHRPNSALQSGAGYTCGPGSAAMQRKACAAVHYCRLKFRPNRPRPHYGLPLCESPASRRSTVRIL